MAAHSWGVCWLVLTLCPPGLDRGRALAIATVHDLAEVRVGDLTPHCGVDPETKTERERKAITALTAALSNGAELRALWEEYEHGSTPEGRLVKACDKLDMGLQAQLYEAEQPELDLSEFVASALARLDDASLRALL